MGGRQHAASFAVHSEETLLRPSVACCRGCGRRSEPGRPVKGKALPLVWSGNVVGRRRGTLTEGPSAAGGGSLERSASPGWEGSREG